MADTKTRSDKRAKRPILQILDNDNGKTYEASTMAAAKRLFMSMGLTTSVYGIKKAIQRGDILHSRYTVAALGGERPVIVDNRPIPKRKLRFKRKPSKFADATTSVESKESDPPKDSPQQQLELAEDTGVAESGELDIQDKVEDTPIQAQQNEETALRKARLTTRAKQSQKQAKVAVDADGIVTVPPPVPEPEPVFDKLTPKEQMESIDKQLNALNLGDLLGSGSSVCPYKTKEELLAAKNRLIELHGAGFFGVSPGVQVDKGTYAVGDTAQPNIPMFEHEKTAEGAVTVSSLDRPELPVETLSKQAVENARQDGIHELQRAQAAEEAEAAPETVKTKMDLIEPSNMYANLVGKGLVNYTEPGEPTVRDNTNLKYETTILQPGKARQHVDPLFVPSNVGRRSRMAQYSPFRRPVKDTGVPSSNNTVPYGGARTNVFNRVLKGNPMSVYKALEAEKRRKSRLEDAGNITDKGGVAGNDTQDLENTLPGVKRTKVDPKNITLPVPRKRGNEDKKVGENQSRGNKQVAESTGPVSASMGYIEDENGVPLETEEANSWVTQGPMSNEEFSSTLNQGADDAGMYTFNGRQYSADNWAKLKAYLSAKRVQTTTNNPLLNTISHTMELPLAAQKDSKSAKTLLKTIGLEDNANNIKIVSLMSHGSDGSRTLNQFFSRHYGKEDIPAMNDFIQVMAKVNEALSNGSLEVSDETLERMKNFMSGMQLSMNEQVKAVTSQARQTIASMQSQGSNDTDMGGEAIESEEVTPPAMEDVEMETEVPEPTDKDREVVELDQEMADTLPEEEEAASPGTAPKANEDTPENMPLPDDTPDIEDTLPVVNPEVETGTKRQAEEQVDEETEDLNPATKKRALNPVETVSYAPEDYLSEAQLKQAAAIPPAEPLAQPAVDQSSSTLSSALAEQPEEQQQPEEQPTDTVSGNKRTRTEEDAGGTKPKRQAITAPKEYTWPAEAYMTPEALQKITYLPGVAPMQPGKRKSYDDALAPRSKKTRVAQRVHSGASGETRLLSDQRRNGTKSQVTLPPVQPIQPPPRLLIGEGKHSRHYESKARRCDIFLPK